MSDTPRGYTAKEIHDREQVMDALAEHEHEFAQTMKDKGVCESAPGYAAFAIDFARTKLGEAARGNAFIAQFQTAGVRSMGPGSSTSSQ